MTSDRVRVRVKVSVPRPVESGIRRNGIRRIGIRRNGVEPAQKGLGLRSGLSVRIRVRVRVRLKIKYFSVRRNSVRRNR